MLCFKKHVGGVGYVNLTIFYMPASASCEFGDFRAAYCTRGYWAGSDPGGFYTPSGALRPHFTAYQQVPSTGLGNWPFLGFD
jgi:hypothetical protein